MRIFLDTANVDDIREAAEIGVLDGVTTNPTLLSKEPTPYPETLEQICRIVTGDVSAEVVATDAEGMIREGRELAKIAPNIVVKAPLTIEGLKAVRALKSEAIRVNVTLCFSLPQAVFAAKAGAYIVSPFVGRLDDIGTEGMELVQDIKLAYENYGYDTQILVASIRHPIHVIESARIGAHIVTMPAKVLKMLFKHPLTEIGLQRFLDDWEKAKSKWDRATVSQS